MSKRLSAALGYFPPSILGHHIFQQGAHMSTTIENIQRQISENPILIYMKGTPQLPQCGFSAQTVQALMSCGERFAFVNVLDNPDIRAELPKYANWPTFPQLWVDGELVGGCDIVTEMYQSGELEKLIKDAAARANANEEGGNA
jgi:monothiol glutaredoxin